ncbi:MAG: exonuclease domain-containing protein [Clostridiales bacterium]|nr:exonuclease domain-containing protein [Clostridiales bacterium]
MYYIVLDLEWNNTYARKTKGFINEIIEFGAVMLDEKLRTVDQFSTLIKSQIGKKLRGRVKELTNITNEDLDTGIPFTQTVSQFKRWINGRENVIMTWGDGDIRVLIDNCRYLMNSPEIPFLSNYVNIQSYFQNVVKVPGKNQISLMNAAEMIGIDYSEYTQHRALGDSLLTAECFKKIFEPESFAKYIRVCDSTFYEKLMFKPYVISKLDSPLVDKSMLSYKCRTCGKKARLIADWKFSNRSFRAMYYCPVCDEKVKVSVSFKKYFDRVEVKKTSVIVPETVTEPAADDNIK